MSGFFRVRGPRCRGSWHAKSGGGHRGWTRPYLCLQDHLRVLLRLDIGEEQRVAPPDPNGASTEEGPFESGDHAELRGRWLVDGDEEWVWIALELDDDKPHPLSKVLSDRRNHRNVGVMFSR